MNHWREFVAANKRGQKIGDWSTSIEKLQHFASHQMKSKSRSQTESNQTQSFYRFQFMLRKTRTVFWHECRPVFKLQITRLEHLHQHNTGITLIIHIVWIQSLTNNIEQFYRTGQAHARATQTLESMTHSLLNSFIFVVVVVVYVSTK